MPPHAHVALEKISWRGIHYAYKFIARYLSCRPLVPAKSGYFEAGVSESSLSKQIDRNLRLLLELTLERSAISSVWTTILAGRIPSHLFETAEERSSRCYVGCNSCWPGWRLLTMRMRLMRLRTLNFLSYESRTSNPAAFLFFATFIVLQLAVLLAGVRYFFRATWDQNLSSGVWAIVATCLVCNLAFCFGEYLFHRYILHIETVRFLRALCSSHLLHHKLTFIGFDDASKRVRSEYPIDRVERDDQSTFPPWALIAFFAFFTPFFAPMAFSFPSLPILISGYAAIAIAYFLYETLHAVNHMPYDSWWKQRIEGRLFGRAWRLLYGFHLAHHANYKCNLNIAGFFGIPLADLVFGTYKQPDPLLLDGMSATKEAARKLIPQPRWPISWLDGVVFRRRRWMTKRA